MRGCGPRIGNKFERVGEWGLVKKMSVPAQALQPFVRINTFPDGFYDQFLILLLALCIAILAA